jgi:GntR family transcriptional repressor for pyruvate dehydrogenase complex
VAERRARTPRRHARAGIPIRFSLLSEEEGALLDPLSAGEGPRALKTSEIVAQRVVADIVADNLQIGDKLPPEGEMVQQYGVSRESVREGLRLLEVQGLITIRRGPGGGPVVTSVDPRNLARTSTLYFHLAGANYNELFDTWLLFEPAVVRQVTETVDRATKKQALAPFLPDYSPDVERDRFMSRSNGFHAAISTLSGNRVLTMILQSLSHIVVEHIVRDLDPLSERQEISDDHIAIGQAMIDGRATRAERLMTEHIEHLVTYYRERFPDKVDEYVQWR